MSKNNRRSCCTPCCPRPIRMPKISPALVAGVALALLASRLFTPPNVNSNLIDINSDPKDLGCDCDCNSVC